MYMHNTDSIVVSPYFRDPPQPFLVTFISAMYIFVYIFVYICATCMGVIKGIILMTAQYTPPNTTNTLS